MRLEQHPHWRVVAEARSSEEAVYKALAQRPNIVVMDVRLPGLPSAEACHEILHQLPDTRVIMLTTLLEDKLLQDAMRAGAVGYVVKRIRGNELIDVIESVSREM